MKQSFTIFILAFIFIFSPLVNLFSQERIDVTTDGKSIVIRNIDAILNCCSKVNDDITILNKKIIITQTDTSTTKCKCDCAFDLIHTVNNLQPGKYKIEIYREELRKFGYPEDKKYLVASTDYEVQYEVPKMFMSFDFRQSPCKNNTRVSSQIFPKKINLEVFPNPTKGELNVRFNTFSPVEVKFVIYNFIGKEVFSTDKKPMVEGLHTWNFNLPNIPSGMYIGKVILSNGSSETIKIVWSK
jgi:hypothetical protein